MSMASEILFSIIARMIAAVDSATEVVYGFNHKKKKQEKFMEVSEIPKGRSNVGWDFK